MDPCGGNRGVRAGRPNCVRAGSREGCTVRPLHVPRRQHRRPGARQQQSSGRRRDGFGRWQNDSRGRNRPGRAILAARASVRSLHSQRALARLLQVARAHDSTDDLNSFHPRDSAPGRARRESAGGLDRAPGRCVRRAGDAARRVWARRVSTGGCERHGQHGGAVPVAGH